ncbi:recombinase family protein [Ferrimicrobium acidiphilum]|uniref:Recombinase family protein n=1 Tax=Ferrimicrobium acidiphilum TaxID=121039 RepID=A0ABV3Y5G8_9ACTN
MNLEATSKITTSHLSRAAYLYVRQSTLRQVMENTESTKRQYALRERAMQMGWQPDQVVVIDSDLGRSGADSDRVGFQRMVAAVGMGEVGVVIGLEVSRLARSSSDWHRLLEICALSDTLILDEDGLYDPAHFNDRLVLGMKGTMSEAELHVIRSRLVGGQQAKARRGELKVHLPIGLVYDATDKIVLDPDLSVQGAIREFFATFVRTGSATATVRSFHQRGLLFPRRLSTGELAWGSLVLHRALQILKNPCYAGAYVYGRTKMTKTLPDLKAKQRRLPQDQWQTLILDQHPGYITWAEYEANIAKLKANAAAYGLDRRAGPPREGPALLQGLVICGRCGMRMTVSYHTRHGKSVPLYRCQRKGIEEAEPICQSINGAAIDRSIAELLVNAVTPLALAVTLQVQDELASQAADTDRMRHQQVERARYEAELAQRRYLHVDPGNRLVAATLEAEWNAKLNALVQAQDDYERQREADVLFDEAKRQRILGLAADFPRLFRDPETPAQLRKRMIRLLIEDVTLLKEDEVTLHVRFRGGRTQSLTIARPKSAAELAKLDPTIVSEVDRLMEDNTDAEIASALNARGYQPPLGAHFTVSIIAKIRTAYGLESRFHRLRNKGMLTLDEMAQALGVHPSTVNKHARRGWLVSVAYNGKQRLYAPLPPVEPTIPCARCQKPTPERTRGQRRRYCSATCRTSDYAARRRESGWVRPRRER